MSLLGHKPTLSILDELLHRDPKPAPKKSHKRDKSKNTPEFNKKAKARREKAKHDSKGRTKNRGK